MEITNGATLALLDEYERAIADLKKVLESVSSEALATVVDKDTKDDDCRSIQTIMAHVIRAGYAYAVYIRRSRGEELAIPARKKLKHTKDMNAALDTMFAYSVQVFSDYPNIKLEEYNVDKKMLVSWGQRYDVEQIMEHAIVHILRHRRQIERFISSIDEKN